MDKILAELYKIEIGRGLEWTLKKGNKLKLNRPMRNLWIVRTYGLHLLGWVAPIIMIWSTSKQRLRAIPFFNIRGLIFWAIGAAILIILFEYSRYGSQSIDSTSISTFLLLVALNLGMQIILSLINYNLVMGHINNKFEKNSC